MSNELRADDLAPDGPATLAKRRWLYRTTGGVLAAIVALGIVDLLGWWHAYGVASATARASGGGYELTVRYGAVTRPALATPFEIVVSSDDGFDEPVTIAVDRSYLAIWDLNGIVPAPASETINGPWVEWEFDPPKGTTLTVTYDGRIEPARQSSRRGSVAVMHDGEPVAEVGFETRIRP